MLTWRPSKTSDHRVGCSEMGVSPPHPHGQRRFIVLYAIETYRNPSSMSDVGGRTGRNSGVSCLTFICPASRYSVCIAGLEAKDLDVPRRLELSGYLSPLNHGESCVHCVQLRNLAVPVGILPICIA